MRKLTIIAAAAALITTTANGFVALPSTASKKNTVYVTIQRVKAVSNLDLDFFKADRADFYADVIIDGWRTRTSTIFGQDQIRPYWKFSQTTSNNLVNFTIRVFDNDGGLEGTDDFCDINPYKGARELALVYNVATGRITGAVTGRRGEPIMATGKGDGRTAQITFVVNHG